MDPIHKEVLTNMTSEIVERISHPLLLLAYLRVILSIADLEEIEAETLQRGVTAGTQTILSILKKRGPKALSLIHI